jgi:hypothetical protein
LILVSLPVSPMLASRFLAMNTSAVSVPIGLVPGSSGAIGVT